MTTQFRPALKWHGGKHYLAKGIVDLMPSHLHYVEPYFGGGGVLFSRDPNRDWYAGAQDWSDKSHQRGCSEVVNDIHGDLTNFWRVLQDESQFQAFRRTVQVTPFSQAAWKDAQTTLEVASDAVERAVAFFIRVRQSRQGLAKDFATLTRNRTRGGRNEQANAWLSVVDGLAVVHERLKGVVILNDDALKVIRQQDGLHTLFYLDPPYAHQTRTVRDAYEYEMTDSDHRELLATIKQLHGKVMLSGYPNELYDSELRDWRHHDFHIDNKASAAKVKETKTERLWMNFPEHHA
jgi:DNA adenine methylase